MSHAQKSKAAKHKWRRCSHCGLPGEQPTMKPIKGKGGRGTVGWLHDPIEGCERASAQADAQRGRHQRDRTTVSSGAGGRHTPPTSKLLLDADEDAFKLADP